MQGNIVGEPFDDFVRGQIDARQQNQFGGYDISRTSDQLQYLTNRNAWVKLASSVNILPDITTPTTPEEFVAQRYGLKFEGITTPLGESKLKNIGIENPGNYLGTQLAEKAVLFNSISEYIPASGSFGLARAGVTTTSDLWNNNFIYGIGGTNYGIQSPPGIIGVQVDSLNRGSIRKATITLKAHNRFQFDIIELLYLRLGFTMMLEWGWDKYIDNEGKIQQVGNTIIEDEWFKVTGVSQLDMLSKIQKKRNDYVGNYDGFFGKVSNFTWNFNPDGSYDISIDLITIGDVIESLKVNLPVEETNFFQVPLNSTATEETKIENLKDIENVVYNNLRDKPIVKAATLNSIGFFLYEKIREISQNIISLPNYFSLKKDSYITTQSTTLGGEGFSVLGFTTEISYASNIPDQYSYYIRLGELLTQLEIYVIPLIQNNNTSTLQMQIEKDVENNLISYFPNQVSLDPKICIFKPSLNSYGDITGINPPPYFNSLEEYIKTNEKDFFSGKLMNIYINFNFISELLISNGGPDQSFSLYKFLQNICDGINSALGGVNKLEPIIKDDYIITLIDQTYSKINNTADTAILEVYGYNPKNKTSNFVKDIKFVSKITPQLAQMISIGATAAGSAVRGIDGTAFSKWSEGLEDRFTQKIIDPPGKTTFQENQAKQEIETRREDLTKTYNGFDEIPTPTNEYKSTDYSFGSNPNTASQNRKRIGGTLRRAVQYYGIEENKAMTLEEFIPAAINADKVRQAKGVYTKEEISEVTGTNYAAYLISAFGGISSEVSILDKDNKPRRFALSGINNLRYLEFDDTFISQGKYAYKSYINILNSKRFQEENTPSSEVGFIPLSFDLILDGISGIKIYNKLSINNQFLPSNYPESLNFVITKVNHRIENNSWDTSLSTISMPKTEPYKFNSVPSITSEGAKNIEDTFRKDPKLLTTSERGIKFIKDKEKFIGKAYDDKKPNIPLTATTKIEGTLTVGYGFTNAVAKYFKKPIAWNTVISQDVADTIFNNILKGEYEKSIQNSITAPLTQYEFDALVSIVYNSGGLSDPLKKAINDKNYQLAANLIPAYKTTQNSVLNSGIISRRAKEQQVFISGNYGS